MFYKFNDDLVYASMKLTIMPTCERAWTHDLWICAPDALPRWSPTLVNRTEHQRLSCTCWCSPLGVKCSLLFYIKPDCYYAIFMCDFCLTYSDNVFFVIEFVYAIRTYIFFLVWILIDFCFRWYIIILFSCVRSRLI